MVMAWSHGPVHIVKGNRSKSRHNGAKAIEGHGMVQPKTRVYAQGHQTVKVLVAGEHEQLAAVQLTG